MPLIEQQKLLENRFIIDAERKYDNNLAKMSEIGIFGTSNEGTVLKKLSFDLVTATIEDYMSKKIRGHNAKIQQFIKANFEGRANILSMVVIESVLNRIGRRDASLTSTAIVITSDVLKLLSVEDFKRNEPKFFSYLEYEYKSRGIGYINSRKLKLADKTGNKYLLEAKFKLAIGTILIDCILQSGANIFKLYKTRVGEHQERHLTLSDEAFEILLKIRNQGILNNIGYKPMIVEPQDWDNMYGNGGYLTDNNLTFIKHNKSRKAFNLLDKMDVDLTRLYKVVNGIQKTKWQINKEVLDVINYIIDNNLRDPEYPDTNPTLYGDIPYMDSLDVNKMVPKHNFGPLDERGNHINKEDYKRWFSEKEIQLKKLESIRSKRIMFMLSLGIANEYLKYEHFYFTYNLDFRGRLYPIQQILNPQSTGAVKALLQFAEGVHLTDDGLWWLKVHIANTYGLDKASYDERVKWVNDNLDSLVKYARDPIYYLKEWNEADDPLMFLAGIIGLRDYVDGKTVNIPISLDGTCSGLQIYSGLLKDRDGGRVVNVINNNGIGSKPADIYTDVAILVDKYLEEGSYPSKFTFNTRDGEKKECSTIREANDLQGNVTRKLTKRNVMTVPYSVTKRGMFDQVRELLDEMEDNDKAFWKGDKWIVAKLLVELNAKAISEIVQGATIGQEFVKKCVYDFYEKNGIHNKPLVWKTPVFEFPVVQWKDKLAQKRVKTVLGNMSLRYSTDKINKQQQNNGVAPNLIHSLDATLMYLTVERLLAQGVSDFMLIHDSFGVCANDIPKLNIAIREAYVELFESNPLESWVTQILPEKIEEANSIMINTLDLKEVLMSKYIFS